jgi:hypothetical protein
MIERLALISGPIERVAGLASHPSAQNAEEWGTPLLYVV